jgi:integrase
MPRYTKHSFQVGEWWLSQRSGSPAWYATIYDAAAKRTRRVSLGTDDFEQARQRLLERYLEEHRPQNAPAEAVALADILLDYYKNHGSQARSAGSVRTSCAYWVEFFGEASVAEATRPPRLEAFIDHLEGQGFATAYTQRILGVGKAALQRAWRRGEIAGVPYIPSVKVDYGEPLGRPLKIAELAHLLREAPDHLRLMLMILIGTACRPEAALELTGAQLDFDDRLIDLNPRGRVQTKKFRPVVKMPYALASVLGGAPSGRLVTFQGRPVKKINKAWRGMRQAAELDEEVNPYSIRRTVARWMRQNGVPAWEVAAQLGHKSREYRTTELYAAFDPAYLSNAVHAIDLLFERLRASFAPVDDPFFRVLGHQRIDADWNFGAGDGIRTHDPNLGNLPTAFVDALDSANDGICQFLLHLPLVSAFQDVRTLRLHLGCLVTRGIHRSRPFPDKVGTIGGGSSGCPPPNRGYVGSVAAGLGGLSLVSGITLLPRAVGGSTGW